MAHGSFGNVLVLVAVENQTSSGNVTGTSTQTLDAFTSTTAGTVPPILIAPTIVTPPPVAVVSTY